MSDEPENASASTTTGETTHGFRITEVDGQAAAASGDEAEASQETAESRAWSTPVVAGLAMLSLLALVLSAMGWYRAGQDVRPGDASVDAGFSRDMSAHHEQAVQMSLAVVARSDDPAVQVLATDILLTQQSQIGMMQGWLNLWELSSAVTRPRMSWMGDEMPAMAQGSKMTGGDEQADMNHAAGQMPGMATPEQVASLSTLPAAEMDLQYLRLMIRHHLGGIPMAEYAAAHAETSQVRRLAQTMVTGQEAEVTVMSDMLVERGADPISD